MFIFLGENTSVLNQLNIGYASYLSAPMCKNSFERVIQISAISATHSQGLPAVEVNNNFFNGVLQNSKKISPNTLSLSLSPPDMASAGVVASCCGAGISVLCLKVAQAEFGQQLQYLALERYNAYASGGNVFDSTSIVIPPWYFKN